MHICGTDTKQLCEDFKCDFTKTDSGITITLSSDDKEKVEKLHTMTDSCIELCCCKDDKDKSKSCC